MNPSKMTVVFEVKDTDSLRQLYEAHKSGTLVCGMSPEIIAWGDQVTVPGEIVDELNEMDPIFVDKDIAELIEKAEAHRSYTTQQSSQQSKT